MIDFKILHGLPFNIYPTYFFTDTSGFKKIIRKPVAHITPLKRNENQFALQNAVRAIDFSWNEGINREPQPSTSSDNLDESNTETHVQIPSSTSRNTNILLNANRESQPSTSYDNFVENNTVQRYRNTNISWNENHESSTSSEGNRNNNLKQNQHRYFTRNGNKTISVINTLEDDSPIDAFEDSGSSYCPSVASDDDMEIPIASPLIYEPNMKKKRKNDVNLDDKVPIAGTLAYEPNTKQNVGTENDTCEIETALEVQENDNDQPELGQKEILLGEAKKYNGRRVRDKGHSCFFCQKIVCNNFARHVEMHHANEMEVAQILIKPKQSKERRVAFANLIRYGDFYHNCEVLSLKDGELILSRRPNEKEYNFSLYSDYGPCPECLGFLLKKQLWHHLKYKCPAKSSTSDDLKDNNNSGKGPLVESTALLNGILGSNLTPGFLDVIKQFRNDPVSNRCTEDNTIMSYGAFLYEKYSKTQSDLIRQSMRQLARLTLEMQKQGEIFQNLSEILVPEKFDCIISATKVI